MDFTNIIKTKNILNFKSLHALENQISIRLRLLSQFKALKLKIVSGLAVLMILICLVNLKQNWTNRQILSNRCVDEVSVQTIHPKGIVHLLLS